MADALKIEIDADTRSAIANLLALAKATDTATESAGKLGKAQKELEEKQAKVKELFAKGFSDDLPEKAKSASAAFALFGDKSLTAGERSKALFAGLSIGKSVVAGYAGAVVGAAQSLLEMEGAARQAEARLEQQHEVVAALGTSMAAVTRATGGAASASDAFAARTALLNAGLRASDEQLAAVVEGARRHRDAGESNADSITRLVAVINGEAAAQERLGIVTRTGADAQERLREVTARLAAEQRGQATAAETATERAARLERQTTSGKDAFISLISFLNPLRGTLELAGQASDALAGHFGRVTPPVRALGTELDQVKDRIRAAANAENDAASAAQNLKTKNDAAHGSFEQLTAAALATRTAMRELARAQATVSFDALAGETHEGAVDRNVSAGARAFELQQRRRRTERQTRARLMRERGLNRTQANNALGLSETAGDTSWLDQIDSLNEIVRGENDVGDTNMSELGYSRASRADLDDSIGYAGAAIDGENTQNLRRRPGESLSAFRTRRLAAIRADQQGETAGFRGKRGERAAFDRQQLVATEDALDAKRLDGQNAGAQSEMDLAAALAESEVGKSQARADMNATSVARQRLEDPGTQLRDAFLPAALETQTAAEKMAEGVSGAFATMTGAVKSHVAALIEGRETAGQAMLGIAHDTLLALATEAAGRSLMSLGGALAATAVGSPTAPLLYASAAAYAGVAALAGAGAAATGAAMAGAAPAASASRTPPAAASAGGSGRGSSEGTAITINVNGTVMDREGTADSIRELLNDSLSRGGVLRAA